jgi:predicted DsbA family dithiol-disulfide isomerase
MSEQRISVAWYSDILCIWAYVGQIRLDEILRNFGGQVTIESRAVPVFSSVKRKIVEGWCTRGSLQGYAAHVQEIGGRYDHVQLHPDLWTREVPSGSLSVHAFVKAAELATATSVWTASDRPLTIELAWRLRLALFRDLRDVGRLDVQLDVASELKLPLDDIQAQIASGAALAALAEDHELASQHGIVGSPTYLIEGGRQKLYGNVGYRVLEANIAEVLRDNSDKASWC